MDFGSTPFDKLAHTVKVRRIASRRGKYNIPNIGIFLWRLNNYLITNGPAFKVDDRRYLFDALGKDIQLYNKPETEDEITHLAEPINVPMPYHSPGAGSRPQINITGSSRRSDPEHSDY